MATLAEKLKMKLGANKIIIIGTPELSGKVSSEGEPYYACQVKDELNVRCSTSPNLPAYPTNVVHIRESALKSDKWQYVDAAKPEKGFWMEGWVADFSINQRIVIYQETTILAYTKSQRVVNKDKHLKEVTNDIQKQVEAFKAQKAGK